MKMNIFRFPGIAGVCCAFAGRGPDDRQPTSPTSLQDSRLRSALAALGADAWTEVRQVHGTTVIFDPPGVYSLKGVGWERPSADGMATSQPGLALLIRTADCQPLLFASEDGSCVMALHVGWRGNRSGFIGLAIRLFCERYDLSPGNIFAVRGPSLGPCCAEFINFAQEWGNDFKNWFDASAKKMDLWALTRSQLCEAGLNPAHIYGLDICTSCNSAWYYSWRAARDTGRQAGLIWIQRPGTVAR